MTTAQIARKIEEIAGLAAVAKTDDSGEYIAVSLRPTYDAYVIMTNVGTEDAPYMYADVVPCSDRTVSDPLEEGSVEFVAARIKQLLK